MTQPYIAKGRTTRYEDRCDLEDIVNFFPVPTAHQRHTMVQLILDAGFTRPQVAKVTKFQLFSYFWETVLLAFCTSAVYGIGLDFVYGALCVLTIGSALTFVSGLIINAGIQKGTKW